MALSWAYNLVIGLFERSKFAIGVLLTPKFQSSVLLDKSILVKFRLPAIQSWSKLTFRLKSNEVINVFSVVKIGNWGSILTSKLVKGFIPTAKFNKLVFWLTSTKVNKLFSKYRISTSVLFVTSMVDIWLLCNSSLVKSILFVTSIEVIWLSLITNLSNTALLETSMVENVLPSAYNLVKAKLFDMSILVNWLFFTNNHSNDVFWVTSIEVILLSLAAKRTKFVKPCNPVKSEIVAVTLGRFALFIGSLI